MKPISEPAQTRRRAAICLLVLGMFLSLPTAPVPAAEPSDEPADERGERLEAMAARVRQLTAWRGEDASKKLPLREPPLLRFNDPTRDFHDAAVWAWAERGRPAALVALERYPDMWSYELISLSPQPDVQVLVSETRRWQPAEPGIDPQPVAGSPPPAANGALRQLQMKQIARRFTAVETALGGETYPLRLLPRPIHRYADPAAGLLDGALFVFANGTNPEGILLIEARNDIEARDDQQDDRKAPCWTYALVRMTTAEITVRLDGKDVWEQQAQRRARPQEPYTCFNQPLSR